MGALIGFVVVFLSVLGGFVMHGGNLRLLWQVSEFIIIGGAGLGSMIAAIGPRSTLHVAKDVASLLRGNLYTKKRYLDLLVTLYTMINMAKKGSMKVLEEHAESPETSELFAQNTFLREDRHAINFLTDTLKVLMSGAIEPHHMDQALDLDLDKYGEEVRHPAHSVQTVADAMPAFGIVAAVLGVIIAMGLVGGDASYIGQAIASALVGTFLGVLLGFGVFGPLSVALESQARHRMEYLLVIKAALLTWQQDQPALNCVEFGRRNILPEYRPSFSEMEQACMEARSRT